MLAKIHGRHGNRSVHVIGGRDQDGVDVFLALQHFGIVVIALGLRQMLGLQLDHPVEPFLGSYAIECHWRLARNRFWARLVHAFL